MSAENHSGEFEAWWSQNHDLAGDNYAKDAWRAYQAGVLAGKESFRQKMPGEHEVIKTWREYLDETIDKEGGYEYDHAHSILETFRRLRDRLLGK